MEKGIERVEIEVRKNNTCTVSSSQRYVTVVPWSSDSATELYKAVAKHANARSPGHQAEICYLAAQDVGKRTLDQWMNVLVTVKIVVQRQAK